MNPSATRESRCESGATADRSGPHRAAPLGMESANGRGTQPLVVLPERLTHWLARNLFSRAGIRGPIDTLTADIAAPPVQTNAGAAASAQASSELGRATCRARGCQKV